MVYLFILSRLAPGHEQENQSTCFCTLFSICTNGNKIFRSTLFYFLSCVRLWVCYIFFQTQHCRVIQSKLPTNNEEWTEHVRITETGKQEMDWTSVTSNITLPGSNLQKPLIHPWTHQRVALPSKFLIVQSFAQRHNHGRGEGRIWTTNPSVIGQPAQTNKPTKSKEGLWIFNGFYSKV